MSGNSGITFELTIKDELTRHTVRISGDARVPDIDIALLHQRIHDAFCAQEMFAPPAFVISSRTVEGS